MYRMCMCFTAGVDPAHDRCIMMHEVDAYSDRFHVTHHNLTLLLEIKVIM